jgi:hypothetical protein
MEDLKVVVSSTLPEVVIRTGEALPAEPIERLTINGQQGTIHHFLVKLPDLAKNNHSHIEVCRNDGKIVLIINPFGDQLSKRATIVSKIKQSKEIDLLGINRRYWPAKDLGDLLRMNQHLLATTVHDPKELISNLRQFEIEFQRKHKVTDDNRATTSVEKSQTIQKCSIPKSIDVLIPLYEGDQKMAITAEVDIDPDSLKCILIVTGLTPMMKERMETLLDDEIKNIRDLEVGNEMPIISID